ncbi:putative LOC102090862 [Columba livia]|uniref:Putative LOC102090862 n=1 Tax=Columba livia TaxID=8932 RepID=A0A2I0LXR2_COLLI|nr:putative LOC102090862 [Columba livia]
MSSSSSRRHRLAEDLVRERERGRRGGRRGGSVRVPPEDDHTPVGSPILLEEVESSPVHMLHLDGQSTAAVKGCLEGENLEDLETARDEQVDLLQGTERTAMSSVQKEKSFALMALAALAPGTLGERYSASVSQPLLAPVKDQAIEVEIPCAGTTEMCRVASDLPQCVWREGSSKSECVSGRCVYPYRYTHIERSTIERLAVSFIGLGADGVLLISKEVAWGNKGMDLTSMQAVLAGLRASFRASADRALHVGSSPRKRN